MKPSKKKRLDEKTIAVEICNILKDNPTWGYRKVSDRLNAKKGMEIGSKKVYRIMKERSLLRAKSGTPSPKKAYIELPSNESIHNIIIYFK